MGEGRQVAVMRSWNGYELEWPSPKDWGWKCSPCAILLGRSVAGVVLLVERDADGDVHKTALCANHAEVLDIAVIHQAWEQYLDESRRRNQWCV